MTQKLPSDAFSFYAALGPERSYEAVAQQYQVSKRTVVRTAGKEQWIERLTDIDKRAREITDAKLATDTAERNARQRKLVQAMAARAAKAIAEFPLTSGMEGVRAAEVAVKLERLLAGEPSERTQVAIEKVTREELLRFVAPAKGSQEDDGEADGADDDW